jgi:hypothetical protein
MTLFEQETLWMENLLVYLRSQLPSLSLITDKYTSEQDLCLYVEKGDTCFYLGAALWSITLYLKLDSSRQSEENIWIQKIKSALYRPLTFDQSVSCLKEIKTSRRGDKKGREIVISYEVFTLFSSLARAP